MRKIATLFLALAAIVALARSAGADGTYQTLPFTQDWTNIGLINVSDDWSGVPGIIGFRGDNVTALIGVDPQTLTADVSPGPVDVNANQTNPVTFTTGGVTEFELTNPAVAIYGSGTADAPTLQFHINSTGLQNITVAYDLRDVEAGLDDAIQPVALHWRAGTTGAWNNVPLAFVADATTGTTDTQVTPVSVVLPSGADNLSELQIRVMTANAGGNDEAVGVDNISVTGEAIPPPTGGCCQPSSCSVTTAADCAQSGGAYLGDGTDCAGCATSAAKRSWGTLKTIYR